MSWRWRRWVTRAQLGPDTRGDVEGTGRGIWAVASSTSHAARHHGSADGTERDRLVVGGVAPQAHVSSSKGSLQGKPRQAVPSS